MRVNRSRDEVQEDLKYTFNNVECEGTVGLKGDGLYAVLLDEERRKIGFGYYSGFGSEVKVDYVATYNSEKRDFLLEKTSDLTIDLSEKPSRRVLEENAENVLSFFNELFSLDSH